MMDSLHALCRSIAAVGLLALSILGAETGTAQAQNPFGAGISSPSPFGGSAFGTPASLQITNPPVSPYLALTQPGLNPGIAFQTIVQPQIRLANTLSAQQQQLGVISNAQITGAPSLAPLVSTGVQTGHQTVFLNTLGYFPGMSARPGRH